MSLVATKARRGAALAVSSSVGSTGAMRSREALDFLDALAELGRESSHPPRSRPMANTNPVLGVVIIARHGDRAGTLHPI